MSDEFDSGILTDCMKCGKLKVTIGFCKKCIDKQIKKAREEGKKEERKQLLEDLKTELALIRLEEREDLNKLPFSVAVTNQSGWLLGFASCWNKTKAVLTRYKKLKSGSDKEVSE